MRVVGEAFTNLPLPLVDVLKAATVRALFARLVVRKLARGVLLVLLVVCPAEQPSLAPGLTLVVELVEVARDDGLWRAMPGAWLRVGLLAGSLSTVMLIGGRPSGCS